jgi:hypothetical protein
MGEAKEVEGLRFVAVPPARDGRPKRTSRVFSVLIFSP